MSMGRSHSPTPARDRAGPTRGTAVDCSASASGGMAPAAPTCGGTVDITDNGGWPLLSRPSNPDSLAAMPSIECGIASQQPKAQRHRRCSGHAASTRRHVGRRYAVNVMHAVTKSIECSSRTLWNAGRLLSAPFVECVASLAWVVGWRSQNTQDTMLSLRFVVSMATFTHSPLSEKRAGPPCSAIEVCTCVWPHCQTNVCTFGIITEQIFKSA